MTAIDRFLPAWEFEERHEIEIRADPGRVDRAVREVTLAELPVAYALLVLRTLPARIARRRRRRADPRRPLLEVMTREGFVVLEDAPGKELALGLTGRFAQILGRREAGPATADEFLAYERADSCKAVMDFRIEPRRDGVCVLSTETRVHAGRDARRQFARYWRVVRPFSGLIRIVFLRAARRRAEGPA
jgi:hypothetical protein